VAEREFTWTAGLAPKPGSGVVGGALELPPASAGAFVLSIQLVAEGFRLREGESWRRELTVTEEEPYPGTAFHLTAEPQDLPLVARTIQALYAVGGQTIGVAFRPIAVARDRAAAAIAEPLPVEPGIDLPLPASGTAPDLTVRISNPAHDGILLWTFETPHAGIELPREPLRTEIGSEPQLFARLLVDKVNLNEGQPGLAKLIAGNGVKIADQMPLQVGELLRAVAARVGGPPTLLLLSEEPYIPWELACIDEPLPDPKAPPFLAAQARVGRWVLGNRRPKVPPPLEVEVRAFSVVSGVYDQVPGFQRLVEAEAEAATLASDPRFKAQRVDATAEGVLDCLEGVPPADVLHFSVHGNYDPTGTQDGLMLVDGRTLDPLIVTGSELSSAPFVFLNACQVGSGKRVLGDYSGLAAAFLEAGAAAVVAPLWSVKDTIAKEIALAFYAATADGTRPAEVLRQARLGFRPRSRSQSATSLAYQFFGHPALLLRYNIP
jgi:hypothetical protein